MAHPFSPADVAAELRKRRSEHWEGLAPREFVDARLDALDPKVRGPIVAEWLPAKPGTNLLLMGERGRGKSFAAWAVLHHEFLKNRGVLARTMNSLLREMKSEFGAGTAETGNIMSRATQAEVLLLDDVGAHHDTKWAASQITELIDQRWRESRPTIITTNFTYEEIRMSLGETAASRMFSGDVVIIPVEGHDRRSRLAAQSDRRPTGELR